MTLHKFIYRLVTADEAALTGIIWNNANAGSYLYTGEFYWTMSPTYFFGGRAYVFYVFSNGGLALWNVDYTYGVRPVINIRSNVELTGTGSQNDPFVVVGAN